SFVPAAAGTSAIARYAPPSAITQDVSNLPSLTLQDIDTLPKLLSAPDRPPPPGIQAGPACFFSCAVRNRNAELTTGRVAFPVQLRAAHAFDSMSRFRPANGG